MNTIPLAVSAESAADGPDAVVNSNVSVVNALREGLLAEDEIAHNAWLSYLVDLYLAETLNGGFSQFIYNHDASPRVLALVDEGLSAMGAEEHRALFAAAVADLRALTDDEVSAFLGGEYFGENPTRDKLSTHDDAFCDLNNRLDLSEINGRWLLSLAETVVVPLPELEEWVADRVALIPDLDERRAEYEAELEASMPDFERQIRALAEAAGHQFETITVGDPTYEYEGTRTIGWWFLTDKGPHVMVMATDAVMLDEHGIEIARLPAPAPADPEQG